MTIKTSVFGSENEKELFKTLHSNWSDKFDLWPNLPFTSIIDIDASLRLFTEFKDILNNFELSDKAKEFLYKTTVDYTLCKKDGKPLLSIEFDGIGHGFSRNGKYIQLVKTPKYPYRKLKLDLKLRITKMVGYPFFVVSYDEKQPIGPGVHLTIVDGIIGKVLAQKYRHYLLAKLNSDVELESTLSKLSKYECDEYIDNLAIEAEVTAEMKWNPIKSLAHKYFSQLREKKLINSVRHYYPYRPEEIDKISGNCTIETPFGKITKEVWVREIRGFGVDPGFLAEEIAELLALKGALDLYMRKEKSHD